MLEDMISRMRKIIKLGKLHKIRFILRKKGSDRPYYGSLCNRNGQNGPIITLHSDIDIAKRSSIKGKIIRFFASWRKCHIEAGNINYNT